MRGIFMACVLFGSPALAQDYRESVQDQMEDIRQAQTMRDEQMRDDESRRDAEAEASRENAQLQAERQADLDRQDRDNMDNRPPFGR